MLQKAVTRNYFITIGIVLLTGFAFCCVRLNFILSHGGCFMVLFPFFLLFFGVLTGAAGLYILVRKIRRLFRIRYLKCHGVKISAEIIASISDWKIRHESRPTHVLLLTHQTADGRNLMFRSENFITDPMLQFSHGDACSVYLDPSVIFENYYGVFDDVNVDFRHYFVDI